MNYTIDENIDFYKELQNMDSEDIPPNTSICLISREPLSERYVSLECGHSFNYLPLFKDIYNHKKKFNYKEGKGSLLKTNQIRCPYCRHIQNSLMPYYSEFNVECHGINIIRPCVIPVKHNIYVKKNPPNMSDADPLSCVAILKSGINKGTQCKNKAWFGVYCGRHSKQTK